MTEPGGLIPTLFKISLGLILAGLFLQGFRGSQPAAAPVTVPVVQPAPVEPTPDVIPSEPTPGGPNGPGYYDTLAQQSRDDLQRHIEEIKSRNEIKPYEMSPGS